MTTRRSQDLTADLLHDLNEEEAAPSVATPAAVVTKPAVPPVATTVEAQPSAYVETALFLAPKTWLRPGVVRSRSAISISAGPLRVRVGRR